MPFLFVRVCTRLFLDDSSDEDNDTADGENILTLHMAAVPDILHTVFKSIFPDMIGIALQIIMIVSKMDNKFRRSISLIDERFKSFFAFNSGRPVRPVTWLHGISNFIKSMSTEELFSSNNILNSAGVETWKLPSMLLQLMFCLGYDTLPTDILWLTIFGFPHSDGKDVFTKKLSLHELVHTALASVLEYMFTLNSKLKSAGNIEDLEWLGNVCRAHYARLFHVRNRLHYEIDEAQRVVTVSTSKGKKEVVQALYVDKVTENSKPHLTTHQKMYAWLFGGETRHVDTELGESLHKFVVAKPWAKCNRSQKWTSHDCMKWLSTERLIRYNAYKFGVAPERQVPIVRMPRADGEPMTFVVSRTTSSQHLAWQPDIWTGKPTLSRLRDDHKHSEGDAFVHSRIGEDNLFDFLNDESNKDIIPTEVNWIRFVTQIKCLGDNKPNGVGEFQLYACPNRLANYRTNLPPEMKVEQFNHVVVEYEHVEVGDDDDASVDVRDEVAMIVGIINYELTATRKQGTRFIIAWMRDADRHRESFSPLPYPVKQMIVTGEGNGGAVRGGNRYHLDIVYPGQIKEGIFLAKQLVQLLDPSMAFANGSTCTWEMIAAERYFCITHARMIADYNLADTDWRERTYPKVFFPLEKLQHLHAMLERPLPLYVKPRQFTAQTGLGGGRGDGRGGRGGGGRAGGRGGVAGPSKKAR